MKALYLVPGLIFLFLGGIFLLLFRSSRTKQERSDRLLTARAWARLTETGEKTERNYENQARTVYYGIYEYDTADGQHIVSHSEFSYANEESIPGTNGKMVEIRYNPNDPTEFILQEEDAAFRLNLPKLRKTGIGLTILGVFLTAAAIAVMLGLFDSLVNILMGWKED